MPEALIARASTQVECWGETQGISSMRPLQLSSLPLAQISGRSELTVGSLSLQSPPPQWSSGSPSPSASLAACWQDWVASTQVPIMQGSPVLHVTGAPGTQPWWSWQTSRPLQ